MKCEFDFALLTAILLLTLEIGMGARKKEALEQFNRDNILSAAKELFEKKGVENTTMDDIAKYADYSKSTIYVYFKSKDDIYNCILERYMNILACQIESDVASEKDFEKGYYRLCNSLVKFEHEYPQYYAGLLGQEKITNGKKKTEIKLNTVGEGINDAITGLLQKGIEKKVLRDDIELEPTVLYVWSAISGIIQVAGKKSDVFDTTIKMGKEEYLDYSFKTFYESLIRR